MLFLSIVLLLCGAITNLWPKQLVLNENPLLKNIDNDAILLEEMKTSQTFQLFSIMTRHNRLLDRSMNTKIFLMYIAFLLIAVSNDVQINPGPVNMHNNSTIYPCGTCDQPVTWDHRAVVCDTCDQWYHINCQDIHSGTYSILNEDENIRWDCIICKNPNYSSVCYDLHHSTTENRFSLLTISDSSLQSPTPTQTLKPIHTSTPVKTTTREPKGKTIPFRILNVNCQSIINKQERIENMIQSTNPDIVLATETWLNPSITDNQIFPSNYTVWRKDRSKGKGGGVMIAVKDNYISSDVPELQNDGEIVWAKISITGCKTLYICAYYNPKTSDERSLSLFDDSIQRAGKIKDAYILIGGDFNLPGWDWTTKTLKPNTQHTRNHLKLLESLDDNGLIQTVKEPTRHNSILDLVITNIPNKVLRTDIIPGISDHDTVFTELDIHPVKFKQSQRKIPLYKKADWEGMRTDMKSLYSTIRQMANLQANDNNLWETFNQKLHSSIQKHIPQKTTRAKDKHPWITKEIKTLIKKRDRLYKRKKKSYNQRDITDFKKIKQKVQSKMRHAYWDYIENVISLEQDKDKPKQNNTKKFWTYIKHKRKDNGTISGLKDKGKLYTEPKQKATILNQQFKSVFSEPSNITKEEFNNNKYMEDKSHKAAKNINITIKGVEKMLQNLNPHKAAGPDNINPLVLKEMATEIAPILTIIYKTSYNTSILPNQWKTAVVHPIYKKGSRYDAANYRPISLTCICCKLMEHIITSHIMNHGEINNILNPLQHGFRKKRSCETQLLEFTNEISQNLENGTQTDVLVMDFAKAFDKVSHSLLIHKLNHYGIQGLTNKLIQAFLQNRSQTVVLDGQESDPVDVQSGVPQGSVLGPSLFLYYINDINIGLGSTVRLFADDTIAYLTVTSNNDCQRLQSDLDKLASWEIKWKMEFHPSKCQVLSITRKKNPLFFNYKLHNHPLEHVTSAKYLGCTLNNSLDWGQHISNITTKANNTIGFLRRNLNIASIKTKENAYFAMVRPTVEHASCIWDPYEKSNINQLEMVQRRAARFVTHRYHNRSSVTDMIEHLHWKPLETRRLEARLIMLYKIINHQVAINPDNNLKPPSRLSRSNDSLSYAVPYASTQNRQQSFYPRTIRDWNTLPYAVKSAGSVEAFRARLATPYF